MSKKRPRLLDLFCGAGGAAEGYHRAGFEVVGVDIEAQPHYRSSSIKGTLWNTCKSTGTSLTLFTRARRASDGANVHRWVHATNTQTS